MTTQVLRPNGNISGATNYTVTGAASVHASLADDLDSSYIRKTGTGQKSWIGAFADYTLPANYMVKQVRLRARLSTPTSASKLDLQLGATISGAVKYFPSLAVRGAVSIGEVVGAWQSSAPTGASWTQAAINELRCQLTEYKDSGDRAYIYEVYADVELASQPTVTVDAPTGTVTDTAAPTVSWTLSDTDGESQSYFEVKVFSSAQYGAADFSPDTATATWASGITSSSEPSKQVGTYLANGAWRAYVRAAKTVNGQPYFSSWSYSAFTVTLTAPAVPTLTLAYTAAQGKVTATMAGTYSATFTYQRLQLQRSDNAGVTWSDVRYGSDIVPTGAIGATLDDYEAVRGNTAYYRVRAIGFVGSNVVASAWSASSTLSVTNDGTWWLKSITDPTLNKGSIRILHGLDMQQEEDIAVFRPIGRSKAVVVSGSMYGVDGNYSIKTAGAAEWAAVNALVTHQGTLLLQAPDGTQKYIRFTARSWNETGDVSFLLREVKVAYVEVDA